MSISSYPFNSWLTQLLSSILSKLSRSGDYRTAMNLIELTKIEINNYFRTTDLSSSFMNDNKILEFKSLSNQLCDFLSEFAEQAETLKDTKYTTVYGESNIKDFLTNNVYLTPLFASLVGLIPNCASSVIISDLYISNILTFHRLVKLL